MQYLIFNTLEPGKRDFCSRTQVQDTDIGYTSALLIFIQ